MKIITTCCVDNSYKKIVPTFVPIAMVESKSISLEEKKQVKVCCLDLRNSIDSVNHRILMDKLNLCGVRRNVAEKIKSYLDEQ